MSVIWSGVTEEGAVVPVQVTDEGKVVAVGDGPEGDYLKLTGGNLTGDLTVNEQIELKTDGGITAAGNVQSGGNPGGGAATGARFSAVGMVQASRSAGSNLWSGYKTGTAAATSIIDSDGSITAAGSKFGFSENTSYGLLVTNNSTTNSTLILTNKNGAPGPLIRGINSGQETVRINSNGSSTFTGDVVVGSKGSNWLIRESNGVAMLIEQTRRGQIEPRMQKVRDLPNELDLIEAALSEVMAKLKMTPPAGWPVWDGQSEVATDNDNA